MWGKVDNVGIIDLVNRKQKNNNKSYHKNKKMISTKLGVLCAWGIVLLVSKQGRLVT